MKTKESKIYDTVEKLITSEASLGKNKNKNKLCLRVMSILGRVVKVTTIDRYQREIVPKWNR